MSHHPLVIGVFVIIIVTLMLFDLGIFSKKAHAIGPREALLRSIMWIGMAMGFSIFIYFEEGREKFLQFQSAYWIEEALSVDNLFVFILVFKSFNVAKEAEHRVLFWGILGAMIMRGIFIFVGTALIRITYLPDMEIFGQTVQINALLTLFGFLLLYAGYKSWTASDDKHGDISKNAGARLIYRFFRVSDQYDGTKFFTVKNGVRMATPLLVVLGIVEFTDLIFAIDSIPAIFAIAPDDPFILYTSNIFAILGLRSLYFLLANFMHMFSRLKYGLCFILSFIGLKMLIAPFFHIPAGISLSVVGSILVLSVIASLLFPVKKH